MEIEKELFKKLFPNLFKEIEDKVAYISIDCVRSDIEEAEKCLEGSTAVDYLRRCENVDEAKEVIKYLEERGEISKEYANRLRKQLLFFGLESFGRKKR